MADENFRSKSLADLVQQQFPMTDVVPAGTVKKEAPVVLSPAPLEEAASIELPDEDTGPEESTVASGDTLGKISALRYGSPAYSPLIKVHNDVDERRLKVGQLLKTPSIATIARESGAHVLVRFPDEIRSLLQVREDYIAIEAEISSEANAGKMPDDVKPKLAELRKKLEGVSYGLERRQQGVTGMPNSTLSQLRSVSLNLRSLEKGDFGKEASRPGRVHTHLGLALTYAIIWGQQGFK